VPRLRSVGWAAALGLLLAGAAGNLCDRLMRAPGIGRGAVAGSLTCSTSRTSTSPTAA
jgi:signal peptidase II